jgi:hypothetical protein
VSQGHTITRFIVIKACSASLGDGAAISHRITYTIPEISGNGMTIKDSQHCDHIDFAASREHPIPEPIWNRVSQSQNLIEKHRDGGIWKGHIVLRQGMYESNATHIPVQQAHADEDQAHILK